MFCAVSLSIFRCLIQKYKSADHRIRVAKLKLSRTFCKIVFSSSKLFPSPICIRNCIKMLPLCAFFCSVNLSCNLQVRMRNKLKATFLFFSSFRLFNFSLLSVVVVVDKVHRWIFRLILFRPVNSWSNVVLFQIINLQKGKGRPRRS